jgi:uncharacterized protein YihD (DUF1040 family)
MRDPNRIPELLKVLQAGWEKVPDWRFGQLIENFKRAINKKDLFYIEDDDLINDLIEYFDSI